MPDANRRSILECWRADSTPRDRRNLLRFVLALGAWAVTFAGGARLLRSGIAGEGPFSWLVAALPAVFGLVAVLAYGRYLRQADEFQQMIHLKALGFGFGGGWLAVAGYRLFELLGAPAMDRGTVIAIMAVLYTVGLVAGLRRYA